VNELDLVRASVDRIGSTRTAKLLGVQEGTVRAWVKGTSEPREKACEQIRAALGGGGGQGTKSVSPPRPSGSELPPPADPVAKGEVTDHEDPRANALATLRVLRAQLEVASPDNVTSIANAISTSSKLLAALSGAFEVTDVRVIRSEAWQRIKRTLVDVLAKYPDALEAVTSTFTELERG
jgi:hypothetical protein